MLDTVELAMGEIPFRVIDPERIRPERYYDEGFFKLEREKLWSHVWQMACRLEQISNVGDWTEYTNLGMSVIIVRVNEGIKAYHNTCRHRGVRLAAGHGNCRTQGFVCPFHGWRWNMEGKNTFVYGKHMFTERQLDQTDLALVPCRVEVWAGCVFINFDNEAPSLRESIGPLAQRLEAHGLGDMRAEWWYGTVLPSNWKLAMEAFMEGYHTMKTHPQLQAALPPLYNSRYGMDTGGLGQPVNPNMSVRDNIKAQIKHMGKVSEGMAGMVHSKEVEIATQLADVDLPEDPNVAVPMWYGLVQEQINKQLVAKGEPVPDLNANAVGHPIEAVEFIFPHYFVLPVYASMASYRIRPLSPETCLFEIWSLTTFPKGSEPVPPLEPTMVPYDSKEIPPITQQDFANIPQQQIGLHGEGFKFMRLSSDREGLISNYQRIIDGYLAGVALKQLAESTHVLAGNFDGKIADLAF